MDDLTITKLCAEAWIGEAVIRDGEVFAIHRYTQEEWKGQSEILFNPLHDDAQAQALVKKFRLDITSVKDRWIVCKVTGDFEGTESESGNTDLNRAICECVAQLQRRKDG